MTTAAAHGGPNPDSISSPIELAQQLRLLKLHAGNPSIRTLSKRAAAPASTVHDVLSGKRGLPQHDNFMKVASALSAMASRTDVAAWRQAWIRVKQAEQGLQTMPQPGRTAAPNDPASVPSRRNPQVELRRTTGNLEKAENDVKALELKVFEAEISVAGPLRGYTAKRQLEAAKRRLASIDPTSYLLR